MIVNDNNDRLPEGVQPSTRVLAMPTDTNPDGDIFGGWIMSQVDIAGAVEARKVAKGRVVTVSVDCFQFQKPVFVGDLISFYGEMVKVGKTSITINIKAYAQRKRNLEEVIKVTEATIIYVAVDENKRPRQIQKP